jgi:stage V sporulation protein B
LQLTAGDRDPDAPQVAGIADPGAVRNTALQLATQLAGLAFTSILTLFLVRQLAPAGFGLYALATGIAGLLVLPAGLGLPMAVGRYVADHRHNLAQVRAIVAMGLRLQLPAAFVAAAALAAAAEPIAAAYNEPNLALPLRCAALAVLGQTTYNFLSTVPTSVRRSGVGLAMATTESAVETITAIALVLAGAGAAGATLGKGAGYLVGAVIGGLLTRRLVGRGRRAQLAVHPRTLLRYAGATFVVDLGISVMAQVDVLLIGAVLTSADVGRFGAVMRLLVVLGYLGVAVAGGVAPRLSVGAGSADSRALREGLRFLIVAQGLTVAPLVVWATPIVTLLLGERYRSAANILQVLVVFSFASAPAALLSLSVTYLGAAQRRVAVVLATLALGVVTTYVLLLTIGLIGAAIADDVVAIVYVAANLHLCTRLVGLDLRPLAHTLVRTLSAATVMGAVLLGFGHDHLSLFDWIVGGAAGVLAYLAMLLVGGELTVGDLRSAVAVVRQRLRAVGVRPAR